MCEESKKFILCDCASEGALLQYDPDMFCIYFAIYAYGNYSKTPWQYRLKACWNILRHGTPYGDQLCFGELQIKELVGYLNQTLKTIKENKKSARKKCK